MALVQELLYQSKTIESVNLKDYARILTGNLIQSHKNTKRIRADIEVEDINLNVETIIPCGLIINELVSNTMKHAFPDGMSGEVRVSLKRMDGDMFLLTVSDNGIGMPDNLDFRESKTLGLQLVVTITEGQLNGTVELVEAEGTEFRIKFRELQYVNRH